MINIKKVVKRDLININMEFLNLKGSSNEARNSFDLVKKK